MIPRPYLFLAGEYNVTMPVVFEREAWNHSMTAKRLVFENGVLHRPPYNEDIKGLIYLARTESYELELENLQTIKDSGLPCWPPVDVLSRMSNRHAVMAECVNARLTTDPVWIRGVTTPNENEALAITIGLDLPYVAKTGQSHQGQDKFLLDSSTELRNKLADNDKYLTVENFYEGLSVRVLFIGSEVFGVQYHNDQSWIKNGPGCDYDDWEPIPGIVEHASKVKDHFGLELAGVDYVVNETGYHFLEVNQYPGLNVNERSVEVAKAFLRTKLDSIQSLTLGGITTSLVSN